MIYARFFLVDSIIALIRDAEYVIPDSFHGTVFSILSHKKFIMLKQTNDEKPGSMDSRLYSLLKIFHLENQIIDFFNTDLDHIMDSIDVILHNMREKSNLWLLLALKNEEKYSS